MKEISFNQIKPFVRYSRKMYCNINSFMPNKMRAYDHRLFYCTDGCGAMQIDGNIYKISAGNLLVFPAGTTYEYIPDSENTMYFYVLNFDYTYDFSHLSVPIPPEQLKTFNNKNILEEIGFSDAELFNSTVYLTNMYKLKELLSNLNDEFNLKMNFSFLRCSALLTDILVYIYQTALTGADSGLKNSVIPEVVEYISNNYAANISNIGLGKRFGYHPNYLNQLFIRHTGSTLHRYIQIVRVTKAIHLLQDTLLPMYEISSILGFKDYSHFSKCFKGITGVSPKQFRK